MRTTLDEIARRDMALNPFTQKQTSIPDKIINVVNPSDFKDIEDALTQYDTINKSKHPPSIATMRYYRDEISKRMPIVSQSKIRLFGDMISKMYEPRKREGYRLGLFLTALIQRSYDAGNNGFEICTQDQNMLGLGYMLTGKEKEPIRVTFIDNVKSTAKHSSYCIFTALGRVERTTGVNSQSITYEFNGKTEGSIAINSRNSTYVFIGEVSDDISLYAMDMGRKFVPMNCTFIVYSKKAHDILKEKIEGVAKIEHNHGCRLELR